MHDPIARRPPFAKTNLTISLHCTFSASLCGQWCRLGVCCLTPARGRSPAAPLFTPLSSFCPPATSPIYRHAVMPKPGAYVVYVHQTDKCLDSHCKSRSPVLDRSNVDERARHHFGWFVTSLVRCCESNVIRILFMWYSLCRGILQLLSTRLHVVLYVCFYVCFSSRFPFCYHRGWRALLVQYMSH
jgi:hypothetical protein